MEYLKSFESWRFFKKPKEEKIIEIKSKKDLLFNINNGGVYLKYDFSIPFSKAIWYDENTDMFLLILNGNVSRIKYSYDDLLLYAKEQEAIIVSSKYVIHSLPEN